MTSKRKIDIIKAICWIGVAADALWTVALVRPQFYGILTGNSFSEVTLDLRLIMGIGASLMAGWTVLLVWTARNPVDRRAVLAFSAVPVIAGLAVVTLIGIVNPDRANTTSVWILVKIIFLCIAMLWGYHTANTIARERINENNC